MESHVLIQCCIQSAGQLKKRFILHPLVEMFIPISSKCDSNIPVAILINPNRKKTAKVALDKATLARNSTDMFVRLCYKSIDCRTPQGRKTTTMCFLQIRICLMPIYLW